MKTIKVETPFVCSGCKKIFDRGLEICLERKLLKLKLCQGCTDSLYELLGREVVPKGLKNMMLKNKKE